MSGCWAVFCGECVLPVLQPLLWHKERVTGWDEQAATAISVSCLEVTGLRSFNKTSYKRLRTFKR